MADRKETVIIDAQIDVDESVESINKLRAANKELTAERNKLNIATEEGRKRAYEINVQIDANTNKIKANSSSLEKQRFNIGNYTASIVEASKQIKALEEENKKLDQSLQKVDKSTEDGRAEYEKINQAIQNNITQINIYNGKLKETDKANEDVSKSTDKIAESSGDLKGNLDKVVPGLGFFADGAKAATNAVKGLVKQTLAFIATPIGAILAALVAVFGLLKAAISTNDTAMDKFENITNAAGVVLNVVLNRVGKLGQALIALAEGRFQDAVNLTKDAFTGLAAEIESATTASQLYLDLSRELEDSQRALRIEVSKQENEIKRLEQAAKNRNLTFEEQEQLIRTALALQEELINKRVENARQDLIITAKQIALDKSLRQSEEETFDQFLDRLFTGGVIAGEELDKIADKVEALEQARGSSLAFQQKLENDLAAIQEKRAAALKKQNDELQKQLELQKKAADQQEKEVLQSQIDLLQKQIQAEQELQRLRLEARPDGLSKELAQLDLALQERISKLKGTEAQITEQTLLLEEQRNQAVIGIREKYRKIDADNAKANREKQTSNAKKEAEIEVEIERQKVTAIGNLSGSLSQFFEEETAAFKILASAQAVINTWLAATAALAADSSKSGIFGILSAAAVVANGLAAVARINGVEFAEGGYTGPGPKYKPAGTVHAGEVVWNQEDVKQVGGPAIANAMRPTAKRLKTPSYGRYADGGVVTTSISQPINQQMEFLNIVKNLPPSEVSVKEINKVQRRVSVKEQISKR